jgi:putative FmdB family regulatory protein
MPTYRYECQKCEEVLEVFHGMSDKPKTKCPTCGGKLVRLIGTGGGVILKGSGFYTTDYRSDSYRKEKKKDATAGSETKSEAKSKPSEGASDAPKKSSDTPAKKPSEKKSKKKGGS